jgi:hypothetical protein
MAMITRPEIHEVQQFNIKFKTPLIYSLKSCYLLISA